MNLLPARCPLPLDTVVHSDALTFLRGLPSNTVNCIVTSPPYFGLRNYGMAGQLGLERTPQEFVANLVELFREARRVLRDDGTCWVNLGDSYANDEKWGGSTGGKHANGLHGDTGIGRAKRETGKAPKNLMGIPWRVAFGLQDDGWILRSEIIWHKSNPMPESCKDRPTKAHEQVFLLAKNERYWYDADAIREPHTEATLERVKHGGRAYGHVDHQDNSGMVASGAWGKTAIDGNQTRILDARGRNKRTVWTIATEPTPFAHFATFPQKLIEPMILAGCPHKVCVVCGAPWVRQVERGEMIYRDSGHMKPVDRVKIDDTDFDAWSRPNGLGATQIPNAFYERIDKGFAPTCTHNAATRPGIVLDMFMGSGTTGLVARRLGRHYMGSELNAEYVALCRKRLSVPFTIPMFETLAVTA